MSPGKWRPFCLGLNVLNSVCSPMKKVGLDFLKNTSLGRDVIPYSFAIVGWLNLTASNSEKKKIKYSDSVHDNWWGMQWGMLWQKIVMTIPHTQCSIQSAFLRALKFTMTPKTESRGSKMTPCHFCGNLKFLVPTSKTMIFLMILIIKSCKHLWYRPNTDPFIAFNFDLHLFCKIKCSALQAV